MNFENEKLESLLRKSIQKKLVLPNFQRDYVWNEEKQSKLIASLLLNFPIGSILLLKSEQEEFSTKELCIKNETITNLPNNLEYLLDGQQRLSTLKMIFSDLYKLPENWNNIQNSIFYNLRQRWFISVESFEELDLFGYKNLKFPMNLMTEIEPNQIVNHLICKKIQVQNSDQWYHPNFYNHNQEEYNYNQTKSKIADYSAQEKLIPLYEIFDDSSFKIHTSVIRRLANNKIEELKENLRDNNDEIISLLEDVDPFIVNALNENNFEQIQDAWESLKSIWIEQMNSFFSQILEINIPKITLPSSDIRRAFAVFEEINQGGMKLDEYDLIVAKSARGTNENLTNSIISYLDNNITFPQVWEQSLIELKYNQLGVLDKDSLSKQIKNQYLNILSLYSHSNIGVGNQKISIEHIKRGKKLLLTHDQINDNTENTLKGISRALVFINFKLGCFGLSSMQYQLMFIPIAVFLINDEHWNNTLSLKKLEYWYWVSLFSGRYNKDQNTRIIDDCKKLNQWINLNEVNPFLNRQNEVLSASKYSDLPTLLLKDIDNKPSKAILQTILQYILSNKPSDFCFNENNDNEILFVHKHSSNEILLEDHHIIPLGTVSIEESSKIIRQDPSHILNSPLNRTYISKRANRQIKASAVNIYMTQLQNQTITTAGHCLPTNNNTYIKLDNMTDQDFFESILTERYNRLKESILMELNNLIN